MRPPKPGGRAATGPTAQVADRPVDYYRGLAVAFSLVVNRWHKTLLDAGLAKTAKALKDAEGRIGYEIAEKIEKCPDA